MRKHKNWLEAYQHYAQSVPSPDIFKVWSGISALAAVMERRYYLDVGMGALFPNLYVFLIAPPGVGKSAVTGPIRNMLGELVTGGDDGFRLGAASLTAASSIDELYDATRKHYGKGNLLEPQKYNAMTIVANELGVFLPAYEPTMMNNLTDLYDGQAYSQRRRYDKNLNFKIDAPFINMLAATTPGYLTQALPEGAWDQGFLSRTILVFSGEKLIRPLFQETKETKDEFDVLVSDLKDILQSDGGRMYFSSEAAHAVSAWHQSGGQPLPDHPRLLNYNTRRTAHLLKLCMIACVSDSTGLEITMDHYLQALDWLIEAETLMPEIFKSLAVNNDMKAMDECWHFAWTHYVRDRKPILEHRVSAFLAARVPVHNVDRMMAVMVAAGMMKKEHMAEIGYVYIPTDRGQRTRF